MTDAQSGEGRSPCDADNRVADEARRGAPAHRASGIGHRALGIGHWALAIGHWALAIGHWPLAIRHQPFSGSSIFVFVFPFRPSLFPGRHLRPDREAVKLSS